MDKRSEITSTDEEKTESKNALEKSDYALIRDLKSDKTSLEKSKIGLSLIK